MSKKMISLEIEEDLKEKLRIEAFNTRKNISSLIRYILEEYFEKKEGNK